MQVYQDSGAPSGTRREYPYFSLSTEDQEIRLLDVGAGPPEAPVAALRHVSLRAEPKPDYETVSYCWGTSSRYTAVTIDGICVDAPSSSETALRYLRHTDKPRTLWIDALCIKQNDKVERSSQVSLMAKIFGNTHCTLVWLGEPDQHTMDAFDQLDKQLELAAAELGCETSLATIPLKGNNKAMHADKMGTVDDTNRALFYLFQNPWFLRVWVVQEVLLASKNQCYLGKNTRTLYQLLCVMNWLSHKNRIQGEMQDVLTWQGPERAISLLPYIGDEGDSHKLVRENKVFWGHLVQRLRCVASDKRDNIFGFLGLGGHLWKEGVSPELLMPDYNKSIKDVYRDAMVFAIQECGAFYPLHFLRLEDCSLAVKRGLPSWVIAWGHSLSETELATLPMFDLNAARSILPEMSDVLSAVKGDVLEVPAVVIDGVQAVTRTGKRDGDLGAWIRTCHSMVNGSHASEDEDRTLHPELAKIPT